MNKLFVALAVLAVAVCSVAIAEDEVACPKLDFKCEKEGAKCTGVFDEDDLLAGACAVGLMCHEDKKGERRCMRDTLDLPCKEDSQCIGPFLEEGSVPYRCTKEECRFVGSLGDYCDTNEDCLHGECKKGRCQLGAIGDSCMTNAECPIESVCAYSSDEMPVCKKPEGGKGDACSKGCKPPLICNPLDMTCMAIFDKPEGSECTGETDCKTDCVCVDGKCVKGKHFSFKKEKCTSDSQCGEDGTCFCSPFEGETFCFPQIDDNLIVDCFKAMYEQMSCMSKHYCYSMTFPTSDKAKNSCTKRHCGSMLQKMAKCLGLCSIMDIGGSSNCVPDWYVDHYCGGGLSTGAVVVIAIVAVAAVAAAGALVYFLLIAPAAAAV